MRFLWTLIFVIALILLIPALALAVLVILNAQVNHSRFFAFGLITLFVAVYLGMRHFATDSGHPGRWAWLWMALTAGLFSLSYRQAPHGTSTESAPAFVSLYDGEASTYPRWHPANLIAEQDQVRSALTLCGLLGHDYDDARGKTGRRAAADLYEDLEYHAEELGDFGSQLYQTYGDHLGQGTPATHRYVYRSPKGKEKAKMPVLLLLHGEAGNLKAGLWALKKLADDLGMAIVAPTHGAGRWEREGSEARLKRALEFCQRIPDLDETAVVLAGYGSGGWGVNLAARTMRGRFRGLIHVGGQFTPESTIGLADPETLQGTPILVLHGAKDRLRRIEEVEKAVNDLKRWKLPLTYQRYEDEGALLLFHRTDDVATKIAAWMRSWRS